jgi:hypothetical protein
MSKPLPEPSAPTPNAEAASAARRLRPVQAAPAQRDPREDGCIEERLGGSIHPSQGCVGWCYCEHACLCASHIICLVK